MRVRVSEYDVAYKVFQSLNHRGKPLSDHDILKSALFERAGFTHDEAIEQSVALEHLHQPSQRPRLRRHAEAGARHLRPQRRRRDWSTACCSRSCSTMPVGDLPQRKAAALRRRLRRRGERQSRATSGWARKRCSASAILRSIHHESWRAPAIMFLVDCAHDPEAADRFFWALDRLAYTMQYSVQDREYRQKRYRRVLDAMDRPGELFDADSPAGPLGQGEGRHARPAARPLPQLQAAPRPADADQRRRPGRRRLCARNRLHRRAHPAAHAARRDRTGTRNGPARATATSSPNASAISPC